jgi:hypothetical protein
VLAVNREREALEAWDPAAIDGTDPEALRRQLSACDRDGDLHRARELAQQAAALARSPLEHYNAAAALAVIERNLGHHEAEFAQARRLMALQPRNELSLLTLRRAADCTGRKPMERWATATLHALAGPDDTTTTTASPHSAAVRPSAFP